MNVSGKEKARIRQRLPRLRRGLEQSGDAFTPLNATHVEDCLWTARYTVVTFRLDKAETVWNDRDRRARRAPRVFNFVPACINWAGQKVCPAASPSSQPPAKANGPG